MQQSDRPRLIVKPWASAAGAAYVRSVPDTGSTGGAAAYDVGFPPATFQSTASGGTPPDGRDVNGALGDVSGWSRWVAGGSAVLFDPTFASAVNGYPKYAILASTTPGRLWQSSVDNNTTNPDSGSAANWIAVSASFGSSDNAIVYPDGKIDQWGRVDFASSGEPVVAVNLAFPYQTGTYNISLTPAISGPSTVSDTWVQAVLGSVSTTGFSAQYQHAQNGGSPNLSGFFWRTIGK